MKAVPFGLVLGCAVALAACSSASTTTNNASAGSTTSTTTIVPGHDSPQAAVIGMAQALANGNLTQACGYFIPSEQAACRGSGSAPKVSGTFTIGETVTDGDRALVVQMSSHYCVQDNCHSNNDPTAGLPSGSTTFDQAYSASQNDKNDPTSPCQRIGGLWYIVP